MKMYTNESQTAKLIELGFEKPKTPISYSYPDQSEKQKAFEASLGLDPYIATVDQIEFEYAYSIGELLSFLPPKIWDDYAQIYWELCIDWDIIGNVWRVVYFHKALMRCYGEELIDALFDMVLRLKEEGVI